MWLFRKQDERKWYWKEVDEMGRLLRMSAQYFRERIDCVVHAMRHGYVHPRQRALATRTAVTREDAGRGVDDRRIAEARPRRFR
jgi:hypothetical protein